MKYLKPCHLRAIGYKSDPPLVQFTDYCWNLTCAQPGNAIDYLNIVLQLMNCTGEIVQLDVSSEDVFDFILNGTADVSVLPLRQTIQRMNKAYFTTPVSYVYYGYMIKEIPQLQVEDYILSSFAPGVLVLLGVSAVVVGILMYIFIFIMKTSDGNIIDWIFYSGQALVGQVYFHVSGPLAAQILIGFWLFFCLTIDHNFQAKLKSFLTLSHTRGAIFTTMDGMIDAVLYDRWTLVLQIRGFSPFDYCTEEQCARLKEIPRNRIMTVADEGELEEAVSRDKHVAFTANTYDMVTHPVTYVNIRKHLLFVRDAEAVPEFLAYVVTKNNRGLRESFNDAIAISSPAFATARAQYVPEYPPYSNNANGYLKGEITVLKFQHLVALYKVSGELLIGAIGLLIAEFLIFRYISSVLSFIREWIPFQFAHVLHINKNDLAPPHFQRAHTVILPLTNRLTPVHEAFAKFYTY